MKMQVPTKSIKLQWVISYTLILGMTNFLMKFNQKPESADECSMRSSGRRKRMVRKNVSTPVKAHGEKQKQNNYTEFKTEDMVAFPYFRNEEGKVTIRLYYQRRDPSF